MRGVAEGENLAPIATLGQIVDTGYRQRGRRPPRIQVDNRDRAYAYTPRYGSVRHGGIGGPIVGGDHEAFRVSGKLNRADPGNRFGIVVQDHKPILIDAHGHRDLAVARKKQRRRRRRARANNPHVRAQILQSVDENQPRGREGALHILRNDRAEFQSAGFRRGGRRGGRRRLTAAATAGNQRQTGQDYDRQNEQASLQTGDSQEHDE